MLNGTLNIISCSEGNLQMESLRVNRKSKVRNRVCVCVCVLRFDVDFTELHSYMTRGEAILQSPEFSVSRKEGSIQELHDKVQVNTLCVCVCVLSSSF